MHWLCYGMTHDSWITKKDTEQNAPEVLETYRNTLANALKHILHPR